MKTLGVCFGATNMQCVILHCDPEFKTIEFCRRINHEGSPQEAFLKFLSSLDLLDIDRIAVTGRNFRKNVLLSSISEAEAVECAVSEIYSKGEYPDLIISSGGETQLVYRLNRNGNIISVHSGNKCASGTGEFFLQQIRRMGLELDEAMSMGAKGTLHKIAGRCSVFCKSDCTHALNKGEPKENIIVGLCNMMVEKIREIIKDMEYEKAALIGGGALNLVFVKMLKEHMPTLDVPEQAAFFEAFGAAIWASLNECIALPDDLSKIILKSHHSFGKHEPLSSAQSMVIFKQSQRGAVQQSDKCILGLDVGSTTTKAVLMRCEDKKIVASIYLRTNGNPVQAAKNCYSEIASQIGETNVNIIGLGVTGSGRQIAALHALSPSAINEIIAHATAAAFFDSEVDTIFEIGGQDAKYTYLTNGVPSDYAMNEACSAGTGSFLEESARESLNVHTEEIADLALKGESPPNFTDQCAAFISSDIKRATQEGISKNDILAGLVYSICMNYLNKVKGARPVGKKIFMQGGVCYNKAVPIAMASLMKTTIIVPPDPGLMGAFGVALEVDKRIEAGLLNPQKFDLRELAERQAEKTGSFICPGGKEKCDRKCEISKIKIGSSSFSFGGACDRYNNLRLNKKVDTEKFNFVAIRQKLLFEKYLNFCNPDSERTGGYGAKTVGLNRAFLTHSLGVLYATFFHRLGFTVVMADKIDPEGIARVEAAFCLPAELSHGGFLNLLKKNLDYIFLPHICQIPVANTKYYTKVCPFVQGEPYYLRTSFRKEIEQSTTTILSPIIDMNKDYSEAEASFVDMVLKIGISAQKAQSAFRYACKKQREFEQELINYGKQALEYIREHPKEPAIVLLGRSYNAFTDDANMGIPHKVASRGVLILPYDMLYLNDIENDEKMYWGNGQKILRATKFIKQHKNLFGFYITNFSCGPDSFLLGFFRTIMGNKPSLTLELDQHTADAGLDTRIEAALDIMRGILEAPDALSRPTTSIYRQAKIIHGKKPSIISSFGTKHTLRDPRVEVVFPSMGRYSTEVMAAIFRSYGIKAKALPVPDHDVLLEGRKNSTCKECLPYILTTGSFLTYLKTRQSADTISLLFMPTGGGPCRLGQYCRALDELISRNKLRNVVVFSLTDENGYSGLGSKMLLQGWRGILVADMFNEITSVLSVAAIDKASALNEVENIWKDIISYFEGKLSLRLSTVLSMASARLRSIPLKCKPETLPVVSLIGEIYVRSEEFSRKNLKDYLEQEGFIVKVTPVAEYFFYNNHIINSGFGEQEFKFKEKIKFRITTRLQQWEERRIRSLLSQCGLIHNELIEVDKTLEAASHLIDINFRGECILTVGLALREILNNSCGVVSLGPFGCMPSRVAEAILRKEMNVKGKQRVNGWEKKALLFKEIDTFPFLALETDGNPFPQLVEANLEAFVIQARRVHRRLMELHGKSEESLKESIKTAELIRG